MGCVERSAVGTRPQGGVIDRACVSFRVFFQLRVRGLLVAHGGPAYVHLGGATSLAAVESAGVGIKLSPFTLRLDAEDYAFKPHLSALPTITTPSTSLEDHRLDRVWPRADLH